MKFVLAYFLSFVMFLASSPNSLVLVDYHCNRDFYEKLCVNKDQPEMNCHGKCELKKESEQSSSPLKLLKASFEFNIVPPSVIKISFPKSMNLTKAKKFYPTIHKVQKGFYLILPQPPQFLFYYF